MYPIKLSVAKKVTNKKKAF